MKGKIRISNLRLKCPFNSKDLMIIFEIANSSMNDPVTNNHLKDELHISDEKMLALKGKMDNFINRFCKF